MTTEIILSEGDMLRELDTKSHADGMSEQDFEKVGELMARSGNGARVGALTEFSRELIRRLYAKYAGKK